MSDFRDITFEGAQIDVEETDHVVRFNINAWYDENKRAKIISEEEDGGSPLQTMQSSAKKTQRAQDASLSTPQ